jgi:hypothetical protein
LHVRQNGRAGEENMKTLHRGRHTRREREPRNWLDAPERWDQARFSGFVGKPLRDKARALPASLDVLTKVLMHMWLS